MDRIGRREEPLDPNAGQRMASASGTGYGTGQGAGAAGMAAGGGVTGAGYTGAPSAGGYAGAGAGMQPGGQEMGDQAQETLSQVKDMAQETAGTVMQQAQEQVSMRLTNSLDQAAEVVGGLADAVESVSRQLRQNNQTGLADYTTRAAYQIDRFADYLEQNDVEDMVFEVENFARRQPAIFLGGAFTLGLLAVRFLKSSAPRSRPGYQPRRLNSARLARPRLTRPVSAYTASGYAPGTAGYSAPMTGSTSAPTASPVTGSGATGRPIGQTTPPESTLGTERTTGQGTPHTFNPGV